MKLLLRIFGVIILICVLFAIRGYSSAMFYDPFQQYFKHEFLMNDFPDYEGLKLAGNLFFRFSLNTIISVFIIYLVFLNKVFITLSLKVYVVAFLLFSLFYFIQLQLEFANGYLMAFYIRRMLIHPILLLVLIPSFYYQNS